MPELQIKTIIADGDETSGLILKQMVQSYCDDIEIVALCNSVKHTVNSIKEFSPGLIFIETELPDGSVFDLLQNWPERNFKVVFVTGNEENAVRAFRFSASGYLLKPVILEELVATVEKVKSELAESVSLVGLQHYFEQMNENGNHPKTIVVKNAKGFTVLKTDEIIYLEADGYCTNFYLPGKVKISSSRNLKFYFEQLPTASFMRVHHSFIVNLKHVKGYNSNEKILLNENLNCSLSNSHKSTFINYFKHKLGSSY